MPNKNYTIQGKVVDRKTKKGVPGLMIEAWDKDLIVNDLVGEMVADDQGKFRMEFTSDRFQELFQDRRPDLFFKIFFNKKEIHSTADNVIWNYETADKEIIIKIDFIPLPSEKVENKFTVSGTVRTTENIAVPGLLVEAFDKKIGQTTSLGKEKTDEAGRYLIDYAKKAAKVLKKGSADLFVQVKKGRKVLAKSDLLVNAPSEANINLTVPEAIYRGPSEYEQLDKTISGLVNCNNIGQLKDEDIEYIIDKLKLEPAKVNRYLHAQKLVLTTGEYTTDQNIPPEIFYGILGDDSLPDLETLVRQSAEGLEQSLQKAVETKSISLFQKEKVDEYVTALKEIAVEIAEREPDDPDAYSIKRLVDNSHGLSEDLRRTFVRHFTLKHGSREGLLKELLEKEPAFNEHIDQITELFTLSDLTQKNMSLVRALNRDIRDSERGYPKGVRDLAKKEIDGGDGWKKYLVKNKIKIPKKNQDGKPYTIKTYASELARSFKKEFPMVDFVHSLGRGKKLPVDGQLKEKFLRFFEDNPGFNLGKTSIDHYLAKSGLEDKYQKELDVIEDDKKGKKKKEEIEKHQDAFKAELRSWQRVYKLLPDDEKRNERAIALRDIEIEEKTFDLSKQTKADKKAKGVQVTTRKVGIDSALKITGMNKEDFIDRWENARKKNSNLEKVEFRREGEAIYKRARFVSFMLSASAWNVAEPLDNVRPAFTTPTYIPPDSETFVEHTYLSNPITDFINLSYFNDTMANLTTLFGSQNYCECQHCQSVLSPAAYLSELWSSLSDAATAELAFIYLLNFSEYFPRRPDIVLLHLNCENTETVLPYIDLVNELLERLVVYTSYKIQLASKDPNDTYPDWLEMYNLQTTYSSEELSLRPENEYKEAYVELAKAQYPFSIPWDKWFEEARFYLDYMDIPLYRLIEAFIPPTVQNSNSPFDYRARRLDQLRSDLSMSALLGLTGQAITLITGSISDDLTKIFGLISDDLDEAEKIPVLMRQLGLWKGNKEGDSGAEDFILMRQILATRYIQDSRTKPRFLITISFKGALCDYKEAVLINITKDTFVRITKFEHLRRTLGWTPYELHNAIMVFSKVHLKYSNKRLETKILSSDFLRQVSHVIRLRNIKKNVSVTELLSWWGPIETGAGLTKISPAYNNEEEQEERWTLYERVFLDKSLYSTHGDSVTDLSEWKYFVLNKQKNQLDLSGHSITNHKAIVSAALLLSETDLQKLIDFMTSEYNKNVIKDELTLANLSAMYRAVSLARFLNITIQELVIAYKLIGIDPFEGVHDRNSKIVTESTIRFIEAIVQIRRSPFSIRDLAYILQHYTGSKKELEFVNDRIRNYLLQLKERRAEAKRNVSLSSVDSGTDRFLVISDMLKQIGLSNFEIKTILNIIKTGSLPVGDNRNVNDVIRSTFKFLTTAQITKIINLPKPLADQTDYQVVIDPLTQALRVSLFLSQSLADFLGAPQGVIKKLLAVVLDGKVTGTALLQDFINWDGSTITDGDIRNYLLRLEKVAQIIVEWRLTGEEIEHIHNHKDDFHGFDWNSIPINNSATSLPTFAQWSALAEYIEVRNSISIKTGDVIKLFKTAHTPSNGIKIIKELALLLNIAPQEVTYIANEFGYLVPTGTNRGNIQNDAFRNGESIMPIIELVNFSKQSGHTSVSGIRLWPGYGGSSLATPFPDDQVQLDGLIQYKLMVVEQIRNTVKAQCSDEQWRKVAREFQDRMRNLQRNKLLDYITSRPFPLFIGHGYGTYDYLNTDDVYDYLLIDPHMNPCMNTTRLKQAISSVQLFIQRILMGLEKGIHANSFDDDFRSEWKWKKNYRVWEAHMKVFLYPENWIEPELRDNKTPFFEEFEGELAQSEIEEKTIEKAFKTYLSKVDEVGNLEVVTFKEESLYNDQNGYIGKELHVIGRTREKPRTHYYRKRTTNDIWLPWERIDLDIDSEVVLLTVFNGLPYIFWPTIKERIQKLGQDNPDDNNNDKTNYRPVLEIRFNWSSCQNGRWIPKKKNDDPAVLMYDWKYQELFSNPEELIVYDIEPNKEGLRIYISMMAKNNHEAISKHVWNDNKLSELFQRVKSLPTEIDWGFISPGWNVFYNNGISKEVVEIIKENVEAIASNVEKQLRINLYAHPLNEAPYNFIKVYVSGHIYTYINNNISISISQKIAGYEKLWLGILGYFLSFLTNGVVKFPDGVYRATYRNIYNYYGLQPGDFRKINKALEPLSLFDDATIDLTKNSHRFLTINENTIADNKLITFAKVQFSGYKLKSKVTNSLGLEWIKPPGSNKQFFGLSSILGVHQYTDGTYPLDDESSISSRDFSISHKNNLLIVDYLTPPHEFGFGSFLPLITAREMDASISLNGDLDFKQFFYNDNKGSYYFERFLDGRTDYFIEMFFHPSIDEYNNISHDYSLAKSSDRFNKLFQLNAQSTVAEFSFESHYTVPGSISEERRQLSFDLERPNGLYNWEIFFHMPFTIAVRLSQQKKFAEAQQWFHYIFNPLASLSLNDDNTYHKASKYWNVLPLHKMGQPWSLVDVWKILSFLDMPIEGSQKDALEARMNELAKDPFQPHRIARLRLGAYQKAVVMKYLDNLIDWGDHLFERDTIESINEATHLYILAARILGPRPKIVPRKKKATVGTGKGSKGTTLQDIRNYSANMELAETQIMVSSDLNAPDRVISVSPASQWFTPQAVSEKNAEDPETLMVNQPVFCVPHNEKLISYWDMVADRLFKVRNCRNIEGQVRELPIFEPPIDPGLLVRGQALGIDISDLLSDLFAPLPPYRFRVMLQKAYGFCADVRNLGGALLSALEKKDAEELSLLRAGHEKQMLKLTETIKKQQIKELNENLKSARVSLVMAEERFEYYDSRKFENRNEKAQVSKLNTASDYQIASQVVSLASTVAYMWPQIHIGMGPPTTEVGGKNLGDAIQAMSRFLSLISSVYSHEANMHSIQGGRERRMDDWQFQAGQARKEIKQNKKQILAAEIRLNITEKELENHHKQQEQAEEVETFMQSKFTNKELYHWMISQVSGIYFQTYKMAVELAKVTQRCYRYEKCDDSLSFIGAAHWDNLKKGLLAGEQLQLDLRRMENEYLQNNKREIELTKSISLNLLAPMQLDRLRYEGECEFTVPELLFDLDYPGQYQRRIKSVSVFIPCVVGPHTIMGCRLSLSTTSTKQLDGTQTPDPMSSIVQSISLSTGQNDSGLFELNHNDERYLPFELRGVNGIWRVEFLSDYPSFDHLTISDLILQIRYTALEDSTGDLRNDVNGTIAETYNVATDASLEAIGQRLDIRRDFPDAWHSFQSSGKLTTPISKALFPYLVQPVIKRVKGISILAETTEEHESIDLGNFNISSHKKIGDVYLFEHEPSKLSISLKPLPDPAPELELSVEAEIAGTITELIVVLYYELVEPPPP